MHGAVLIVPVFVISVIIGAILKRLFHPSKNKHTKKDDVPCTEYDEFDWCRTIKAYKIVYMVTGQLVQWPLFQIIQNLLW